jgi:hypothetical protein
MYVNGEEEEEKEGSYGNNTSSIYFTRLVTVCIITFILSWTVPQTRHQETLSIKN